MLYEWKPSAKIRNLGDALGKFFVQEGWREDREHVYFPIGSVICNETIELVVDEGYTPVFVGCGWRGTELKPELVHQSIFWGVRGPDTQQELQRHDIEVEVTLDPAYQLPKIITAGEPNGKTLLIPHLYDPERRSEKYKYLGADYVAQPLVKDMNDVEEYIKLISGAKFVLAGAMHAAIIAHAYGVPFAPFADSYVDCPPKWVDWQKSVNLGETVYFSKDLVEAYEWHNAYV